ncbi:MAG: PPC domain-containing protein [Myxococcaceae bacterium]
MKRVVLWSLPACLVVLLSACGPAKKSCKDTGCSAGAVCNATTGACDLINTGGGGGGGGTTGGGGGTTGGGGGTGGGTTGGGGGTVVDPFDDGGVFVAGDICSKAIPVAFVDGGATVSVDLAQATEQYESTCSSDMNSGADLIFQLTLPEAKALAVSAKDNTDGGLQDLTLTLLASPCPLVRQVQCNDSSRDPETLDLARVPAGTWYVLLENYSKSSDTPGPVDVTFTLTDAAPGPANDSCSMAQALTLTNGMAMATGTTAGAFNDSAGSALSCSSTSASEPEVYYSFTLAQDADVTVTVTPDASSSFYPAVAVTRTCGGTVPPDLRACDYGSPATALARRLTAGTWYIVVDGDGSSPGPFTLSVATAPATAAPTNESCTMPATLTPGATVMGDADNGTRDYTLSCSGGSGGDLVYTFTTTQAQKVTLTATSMNGSDLILGLRGGPCDTGTEVDCQDSAVSSPEVISRLNLPAGTYFVFVQAYGGTDGQFGLSLQLDPPVLPPPNDTCSAPATLMPNVSQNVDLAAAATNYTVDCSSYSYGDVVYQFTLSQPQRVTVTATGTANADAVLELRSGACDPGTSVACADTTSTGAESVIAKNLAAGTYYVVLGSNDSADTQFGISLTVEAVRGVPANDTCSAPEAVTFTAGMATKSVDLSDAHVDLSIDCRTTGTGEDVVYSVTIPAMQTLTVTTTQVSPFDVMVAAVTPTCAMAASVACADSAISGPETITVPNMTASPLPVFVIVKSYRPVVPEQVNVTFQVQ